MEVVQGQPLRRRIEQVGERECEPGTLGGEGLAGEPVDGKRADRDRDRLRREEHVRARPREPEGREGGEDRVEVGREAGDLVPAEARHLQRMAVRGRPDGLHHVAEVEAAGLERAVAQDGERREGGCVRGDRAPEQKARALEAAHHRRCDRRACARSRTSRQRAPSTSSLACSRKAASPPSLSFCARARSVASRPTAAARACGSPGGTSRALSSSPSSSRAAGVSAVTSGVPQARAWKALFGITLPALSEAPKIPRAPPARWSSPGRRALSTQWTHSTLAGLSSRSASSWPLPTRRNRSSGAARAAARIVSTPWSGISLPTKRHVNGA